jgi:error-prone DNA polymerase
MSAFTHLNVSSGFSFRYGTTQPEDLVARAAEFEMPALALTDRENMAGAIRFATACESFGIAPILGVNLSFSHKKYRITLLSQAGHLSALYKLVSAVNADNDENILTHKLLEELYEYSSKVLVLHGADSEVGSLLIARKVPQALSAYQSLEPFFARQGIESQPGF